MNGANDRKDSVKIPEDASTIVAEARKEKYKQDFFAHLSHDLRTPLNAIIGMTAIARSHLDDEERVASCLSKIDMASRHLMDLINDAMEFNRVRSGEAEFRPEVVSLIAFGKEIIPKLRSKADAKNQILLIDAEEIQVSSVIADPEVMGKIITVIVENAINYTPEGGHITLTFHEEKESPGRAVYTFICEDDGVGMELEYLEHVFEPLLKADDAKVRKTQGAGFGMAIVKALLENVGGTIGIKSAPGQGTKVTVTVPLDLPGGAANKKEITDEDILEAREELPETEEDTGFFDGNLDLSGKNILLVEDNELNAELAMEIFEATNADINWVRNGKEAVEAVMISEENFYDIIFMDIQMPVMNGYEATMTIRELPRKDVALLPIIALTANAFSSDARQARNAGMNEHLTKPIEPTKLEVVLRKYLID